jgi:hypothetical protein
LIPPSIKTKNVPFSQPGKKVQSRSYVSEKNLNMNQDETGVAYPSQPAVNQLDADWAAEHMQVSEGHGNPEGKLKFKIQPDFIRFIAYICFWLICIFAILLTTFIAVPQLLEGPEEEGNKCPPFDTGEGFDIKEDSHLIRSFGFNNVSDNGLSWLLHRFAIVFFP